MKQIFILVTLLVTLITSAAHAAIDSKYGVTATLPIISKDPQDMRGYRGAVWYQPPSLIWNKFSLYFDLSFAHWYVTSTAFPNRDINITTIAPILRYYIMKNTHFTPYAEVSIGASYLSSTHFDRQNLGMHFAFQDILGIGALLGKEQNVSVALETMHYSNGSLCSMNAGITTPLLVNVGYAFG